MNGGNWYAMKSSGSIHSDANTWYYASSTSGSTAKYTGESTPFYYETTVGGVDGGTVTIQVGTGWNGWTPSHAYTYTFYVDYPAAASYTVSYNANGGSGAPGNQTKYQGYNLTLSSSIPTRPGYAFNGWNTSSSGNGTNYSAGQTYTGDGGLTLYAKWTPTYPIYSAPALSREETTISWGAFTLNVACKVDYSLDGGSH